MIRSLASRLRRLALPAALGAALCGAVGCTPWPDEGTGGIAERRPAENDELQRLERRLEDAIARGSRHSYAAQTAEAELQLIRTRRTWSAGFAEDYVTNYEVLDVLVRDIEAHVRRLPSRDPLRDPSATRRKAG
ncbi:MAG: hypothetical protein K2P80_01265 [Beijerinckiaceae bacterium]|nr:hypothetical protein [Beijerinckiaceae bacterium]